MTDPKPFLSPQEEQEIVNAIVEAEKNTSGEVRVHIEKQSDKTPFDRAQEVFYALEMQHTKNRNGVLFYVGIDSHSFVILGDQGINQVVSDDFWNSTKDIVIAHFKNRHYKQGLIEGILKAGQELKNFFPYKPDSDTNELPNEISKG
ncbi:MAG TPA: TPM domain-containing protein [Flavobacterium sp.]|nr:TPM domain-containing protein [Flavobacterium sp.]